MKYRHEPGASTCARPGFASPEELFAEYAAAGIHIAELAVGAGDFDRLRLYDEPQAFAEAAEKAGVKIRSVHIPFGRPFDNSVGPECFGDVAAATERFIDTAAALGAEIAVIHPGAEPNEPEERTAKLIRCRDALRRFGAHAAAKGLKLAVENLPRTCLGNCPDDMLYLTDDPTLWVCFDTNHSLLQTNAEFLAALAKGGARIATVHVSDYDFVDEKHRLCGAEGCVNDWDAIVDGLEACGYTGPMVYEVAAPLADIKANYDKYFAM